MIKDLGRNDIPVTGEMFKTNGVTYVTKVASRGCNGCDGFVSRDVCATLPICGHNNFEAVTIEVVVCNSCGSPRVFYDAYKAINTDEVLTYDDVYCADCDDATQTTKVHAPSGFNLETDYYNFDESHS